MSYQLYEVQQLSIANEEYTVFQEVPTIEWQEHDGKWNEVDSGYLINDFNSEQECIEKIKELFERARKNSFFELNAIKYWKKYTIIQKIKF